MKKNGKAESRDLHILIEKEDRLYSALCLELDVASQGRTVAEAKKNIVEAIELFLESVYASGDEKEFIPRPASVEERTVTVIKNQKRFAPKTLASMIRQSGLTEQEWLDASMQ